jgi:hypothetical protein
MAHPTSEGCHSLVLSTGSIRSTGLFGRHGSCVVAFETYGGERIPVTLTFSAAAPFSAVGAAYVDFDHVGRRSNAPVRYRVELLATSQPFGGHRWWFICPLTGRRVTKLFLPFGADRFASRAVYRLGYASQRQDRMGRAQLQALKVYRRLQGDGNWRDGPPPKPMWMRWQTYERFADKLDHYNARFDSAWSAGVMRRFPRLAAD